MLKALKTRQICLFFLAFLPVLKLFMMPSKISETSHEDEWISILLITLLDFLTLLSILLLTRKTDKNLFEILQNNFGKIGKNIILLLYVLYFILKGILPISEQEDYVELTLYTAQPTFFAFVPIFVAIFFISTKKLRILGRCADIFCVFSFFGIVLIISLSLSNTDFSAILPIGANGIKKILTGSLYSANWFGDSLYLLFFIGEYEKANKYILKISISYLVSILAVLMFVIVFYGTFTAISFRQRFALTDISRYATVINNIGRFDYIAIFIILLSCIISLSLPTFFASRTLDNVFNSLKIKWIFPLIICIIYILILVVFSERLYSIETFLVEYACVFFVLMSNILPIFILLINKIKGEKNENKKS